MSEKQYHNAVTPKAVNSTVGAPPENSESVVVRIPRSSTTVSVRLNTKLMAEQKETERQNEAIRRASK